ncbi:MAG: thermonuclease family protein [Rhizobiaceae bacterium]|nr:thermonuclease family protein [Rhizobiaceae bacterium]
MRSTIMVLAIGTLAMIAAVLLAGRAMLVPEIPEPSPMQEAAQPQRLEPAPRASAASSKASRVRPVAPDVVAIPPVEPRTLVRIEPREPLSPFGQPLPPPKVDNSRIHRPVADAAGRILGQGLLVDLTGVDIVESDELCLDPDGFEWPCGMRARTAFRGLLRGRAVKCDVPPDYEGSGITTTCSLGRLDLGGWIVANGWGRATPGGPYEEAERSAREAEKGIFGRGPTPLPVFTVEPNFMNGG